MYTQNKPYIRPFSERVILAMVEECEIETGQLRPVELEGNTRVMYNVWSKECMMAVVYNTFYDNIISEFN